MLNDLCFEFKYYTKATDHFKWMDTLETFYKRVRQPYQTKQSREYPTCTSHGM